MKRGLSAYIRPFVLPSYISWDQNTSTVIGTLLSRRKFVESRFIEVYRFAFDCQLLSERLQKVHQMAERD